MLEIRFHLSNRSILKYKTSVFDQKKSILNGLKTMSVSVTVSVTVTRFEFEHCQNYNT